MPSHVPTGYKPALPRKQVQVCGVTAGAVFDVEDDHVSVAALFVSEQDISDVVREDLLEQLATEYRDELIARASIRKLINRSEVAYG